jgi:hypothetical protein
MISFHGDFKDFIKIFILVDELIHPKEERSENFRISETSFTSNGDDIEFDPFCERAN